MPPKKAAAKKDDKVSYTKFIRSKYSLILF